MSRAKEGFVEPEYGVDVDFKAHIAATPKKAMIKGMFFTDLVESLRGAAPDRLSEVRLASRRFLSFSDYPSRDFFELLEQTVAIVHTRIPTAEGVRRLGRSAFPRFVNSVVGKVVVGVFFDDIDRLLGAMARSWKYTNTIGTMHAKKLGAHEWYCEVREFPGAIIPYLVGTVEGIFEHYKLAPTVMVRDTGPSGFDLYVYWTELPSAGDDDSDGEP